MLYDLWRNTVRAQPNDLALRDLGSRQSWTFAGLDRAAAAIDLPPGPIVFPQGFAPTFLFTVLAAWRSGRVVCPLEPGQPGPVINGTPPGCVHLKLTSASTGSARLIAFLPGQLVADVDNIMATMGLRRDWPNLGVISLAHSYGFSNLVLPLLLRGIPLVLCPTTLPEVVCRGTRALGAVTLPAVPALWQAWQQAGAIDPAIRLAISAGAPLPLPLEHEIHRTHGLKVHNFYGASECGGICYDASPTLRQDTTCVGPPMTGVAVGLNDSGCLTVRSKAVGQCYWPTPDSTLKDGVFHTTDLARVLKDQVHLHGRAADVINVAGRKVLPESIEQVLRTHPAVRDCLVFGIPSPDPGRGDVIVSVVAGSEVVKGPTFRSFLQERLPAWQIPREWHFVQDLNPNQRGKLSRADWRQRYLNASNEEDALGHMQTPDE